MPGGAGPEVTTAFFFYGSLRHQPLLEFVLGRAVSDGDNVPATLENHAVYWAQDQSFPMIRSEQGASAKGVLVVNLSETEIERLSFYESGFEYHLNPLPVLSDSGVAKRALVFFPDADLWSPGDAWSLTDWERDFGALSLESAKDVMSYFGSKTKTEIAGMFGMIKARATARLTAQAEAKLRSPSGMSDTNVRIAEQKRAYADFYALDEYQLSFDRFDGTSSDEVKRAVFLGGDAVIVLPYDPVRDRVLLVEQFRMGPLGRGDPDLWQLEPIAGLIDAGETPEDSAQRETMEEAGLTLRSLEKITESYSSPGASTSFFYMYLGITDLPDMHGGSEGGLASESENIRSHLFDFDGLMEMTDTLEIRSTPLVLAALWLARHRDRLRSSA
ncbi:MAG: NUDIX domain-containing protein [Paracoccaceae bacterium]